MNINNEELSTGKLSSHSGKNSLRFCIRLALAGSVLASGMVAAQLQDHGPSDAAVIFPVWYRDLNNTPLQLCRPTSPAAATMCFPLPPDPSPPSFAGNIGPEVFYMNLNADVITGAIDLRYVAGLEAAYGTANPVGAPRLGQEVVFARTRFLMTVNTTDGSCAGTYKVIHPYGNETFTDVPEGKRALFSTLDIPIGAIGNFEGVLNSQIGPFLHWDDGLGNAIPHIAVGAEQFIGDPTVQHTYTGSPFVNPADGTAQNYLEVQAPATCDLDGVGGHVLRVNTGLLMGQVFTAPIATPTKVTGSVFSRSATGDTVVDVYATTAPGNTLILTGQGMPSVQMKEDITAAGAGTSKYFAHLEYNGLVPPTVTVTNITSNPVIQSESPLVDHVEVTRSEYDPVSHTLCVNAHSFDQTPAPNAPELVLAGPDGGVFGAIPCPAPFGAAPDQLDLSYSVVLDNLAPAVTSPAQVVAVQSSHGGSHGGTQVESVVTLTGAPDNLPGAPLAGNDVFTVPTGVATNLNVGANDGVGTTIIIGQPSSGTVVAGPAAGTVTYTPAANTAAGAQSFTYVVQDAAGRVSNLATVNLTVNFVAQPPTANPENFAVQANTTALPVFVLANDTAALGTTINPGSIQITQPATRRGVATANPNGTVTYRANGAAGSDFFTYTVANSAGGRSNPTRVDVSVAAGAENISYVRNRFVRGTWDLRLQENTAGWFGGTLTPTASCYLVRQNGVNLTPAQFIGSTPVTAAGAVLLVATAGSATPNGGLVPNVPTGQSYTVQCATTNHAAAFPSLTNTANTPTNATTAQ